MENKIFLHEFRNLIYANFSRDEFELKWKNVVEKYKLGDNNWVKIIHQMKEKLSDHLFEEKNENLKYAL